MKLHFWLFLSSIFIISLASAETRPLIINKFGDDNGTNELAEKILLPAYSSLNIPVQFVSKPGKRALMETVNGTTDGELVRIDGLTKKYPSLRKVNFPVATLDLVMIVRQNSKTIKPHGWNTLKDLSFAFVRGLVEAEINTEKFPHRLLVASDEQTFQLLLMKRVDAVVAERNMALFYQKEHGAQIKILNPSLKTTALFHYLHVRHQHLIPKLEKALYESAKTMPRLNNGSLSSLAFRIPPRL